MMHSARGERFAWLGRDLRESGEKLVDECQGPREARAPRLPSGFFRAAFELATEAMLAVSTDGRVMGANGAACTLFGLSRAELLRTRLADLEGGCEVTGRDEIAAGLHLVQVRPRRDREEPAFEQAHLYRADRLSTFGMLAVGVAHEINNPLMYATANLRAALRRMPELIAYAEKHGASDLAMALEQGARMLATAEEGMDRVGALVRDLRAASHEGDQQARVDLRQVLESCINIAHGEVRQHARLLRDYAEAAVVEGNPGRLGQVFLNLLVNAAQAMPGLRGAAPSKPGEIRVVTRHLNDAQVAVEIADDGQGIAPEVLDRIFEPFFTTKAPGEGTGLGLYIARSIVHEHGGRIEVESTRGVGTTMRVVLPRADGR